jgi:hypothetical protein
VLALSPSRWLYVEGADKKELYPYRYLGYRGFVERGVESFDSRTCELRVAKGACAKASCGHVEVKLAPCACSHKGGFRRTCGSGIR